MKLQKKTPRKLQKASEHMHHSTCFICLQPAQVMVDLKYLSNKNTIELTLFFVSN